MHIHAMVAAACMSALAMACSSTPAAVDDAGVDSSSLGAAPDPLEDTDAAVPDRVRAIFTGTCAGIGGESSCHANGAANLRLLLGDGGDVIDVPSSERPSMVRVRPFDPEASYLYLKVRGDGGIDGSAMPLSARFDPRYAPLIASWIEAGAP